MSPFSCCGVSPPVLLSMLGTRSITRKICTAAALAAATASPYVADCPIPIPPCRTPKTQTTVEPGEKRKQEEMQSSSSVVSPGTALPVSINIGGKRPQTIINKSLIHTTGR